MVAVAAVTVATGGSAVPVIAAAAIGAGVSAGTSVAVQYAITGKVDISQVVVDASIGTIIGALGGAILDMWV